MRTLKAWLWIMAVFCLLAVTGVFLSMEQIQTVVRIFGGEPLPEDPEFLYLIRVGSATYVAVGLFYAILALNPKKYGLLVPFSGWMAIFIGMVCGVSGFWLALPFSWFISDAGCTLILGILIVISWHKSKGEEN